ncbi:MAG: hypothetical protein AAF645_16295 [Myxococcota bacterium]
MPKRKSPKALARARELLSILPIPPPPPSELRGVLEWTVSAHFDRHQKLSEGARRAIPRALLHAAELADID